jgi:pyruvate dehydrogenase (quinone)
VRRCSRSSTIPRAEVGGSYFQETDPDILFADCSVYNATCSTHEQVPRIFEMAFQYAVSQQGVAVVSMAGDVAEQDTGLRALVAHRFPVEAPAVAPSDQDVDAVAELIDRHQKITLFCGAGVRNAHAEVVALAERIKAPVGYTLPGKECIEAYNPYAVGLTGLIGFGGSPTALDDADLLLLVGTDVPYQQFIPAGKTIVQIDSRPEHLGRRAQLDYGIAGDAALTLRALIERVTEKSEDSHLQAALKLHEQARRKLDIYVRHSGGQSPVGRIPARHWSRSAPPDWQPGCRNTPPGRKPKDSPKPPPNSSGTATPTRSSTSSSRTSATSVSYPASKPTSYLPRQVASFEQHL